MEHDDDRSVYYKTVETFSGILGHPLALRDAGTGACRTDGRSLLVRLDDKGSYEDLEHLLAHVLLRSDYRMLEAFVTEYTERCCRASEKHGVKIDSSKLSDLLRHIINLLDDRRVNELWGRLYQGSYHQILEKRRRAVSGKYPVSDLREQAGSLGNLTPQSEDDPDKSLASFLSRIEAGVPCESEEFEKYREPFEEALRKVQGKSFRGTLVLAKWLTKRMVDEVAEDPWDAEDRCNALQQVSEDGQVGSSERDNWSLQRPQYKNQAATEEAEEAARQAIESPVGDEEKMDQELQSSEPEMDEAIEDARERMKEGSRDDWLRKGVKARVVFRDAQMKHLRHPGPLPSDDKTAAKRLKSLFLRVRGKRATTLAEEGEEIDVDAYIDMQATGEFLPCFRQELRGQGFRCLLLIDRSGSMAGPKTEAVSRATRILQAALKLPSVSLEMWGFQGLADQQLDIIRYPPKAPTLHTKKYPVGGSTPTHVAIRVASKELEGGTEVKQLILLTDGIPAFSKKGGEPIHYSILTKAVREEVNRAESRGIHVTTVLVKDGSEMPSDPINPQVITPEDLFSAMFGSRRSWRCVDVTRLGPELIRLVTTSFLDYLRKL